MARRLNYIYVDTGAMYRAVALKCLRDGIDIFAAHDVAKAVHDIEIRLEQGEERLQVFLDGENVTEEIRSPAVGGAVSTVSAVPAVREALVAMQRKMAARGGVVMDGRDIGTVVLPNAEVKVFLTASIEERARRRHLELESKGVRATADEVLREIKGRDERDSTREISPLKMAADAVLIDTTGKSVDHVVAEILDLFRRKGGAGCSTT